MPGTLRRFNCTYGKTGRKLFTLCCYTLEVIILTEIMNLGTGKLGNRTNATSALIVHVPTTTLLRAQCKKVSLPPHTEGYCAAFSFLLWENRGFLTFLNLLNDTLLMANAVFLRILNTTKKPYTFRYRGGFAKKKNNRIICCHVLEY